MRFKVRESNQRKLAIKPFFPAAFAFFLLTMINRPAFAQRRSGADDVGACAACSACGGGVLLIPLLIIGIFALNIALLVWVARDAKARGMDSSILWMVLVMFTGLIGLVLYLFSRPQGEVIQCHACNNKRLQASAKCPHCGNA